MRPAEVCCEAVIPQRCAVRQLCGSVFCASPCSTPLCSHNCASPPLLPLPTDLLCPYGSPTPCPPISTLFLPPLHRSFLKSHRSFLNSLCSSSKPPPNSKPPPQKQKKLYTPPPQKNLNNTALSDGSRPISRSAHADMACIWQRPAAETLLDHAAFAHRRAQPRAAADLSPTTPHSRASTVAGSASSDDNLDHAGTAVRGEDGGGGGGCGVELLAQRGGARDGHCGAQLRPGAGVTRADAAAACRADREAEAAAEEEYVGLNVGKVTVKAVRARSLQRVGSMLSARVFPACVWSWVVVLAVCVRIDHAPTYISHAPFAPALIPSPSTSTHLQPRLFKPHTLPPLKKKKKKTQTDDIKSHSDAACRPTRSGHACHGKRSSSSAACSSCSASRLACGAGTQTSCGRRRDTAPTPPRRRPAAFCARLSGTRSRSRWGPAQARAGGARMAMRRGTAAGRRCMERVTRCRWPRQTACSV